MSHAARALFRECVPPVLLNYLRAFKGGAVRFDGRYSSWKDAKARASGYDSGRVLEAVKSAALKVKNGQAAFERDSVLFDSIQFSFPALAAVLRVAAVNGGEINVLDFGGSLGTSYNQFRHFVPGSQAIRWSIVEQEHFVACGRQFFENDELKFYRDIEECLRHQRPTVLLLSSVLQYIEDPYPLLARISALALDSVVIDRTPFTVDGRPDFLTVQIVPPAIYEASYPSHVFCEKHVCAALGSRYGLLASFETPPGVVRSGPIVAQYKGLIFSKTP